MGVVTAIGNNVSEFWEGLLSCRNGIDYISRFDTTDFPTRFGAEIKNLNIDGIIDAREARRMDLFAQYAVVAAHEAVIDSGIDIDKINHDMAGVVVGSGTGGIQSFANEHQKFLEKGPRRVSPYFVTQMISDIVAGLISIRYGFKGPNYATVSACATSAHAIGDAFRLIKYGDADVMITGGTEAAITEMSIAGFSAMKALSMRNDDPKHACRPFDRERDGFVMGEGAGILVLEELEHAKKRGAKIYAEVLGIGFTGDAHHVTAPAPGGEGATRAMRRCLKEGQLSPTDVQYINAHGTSTPYNDTNETAAIKTVFGDYAYKLNISSTKSMVGHLLGAAGAVELIATALAVYHDIAPPTINYEVPDPECDLNYTPNQPQERKITAAISNAFGFGGHNACLLLGKFEK
jgi:3-oxoacyl-[acyl-carrier-protein] synthase II